MTHKQVTVVLVDNDNAYLYVTVEEVMWGRDWAIQLETNEVFRLSEVKEEGEMYLDTKGNTHYDNHDLWDCRKIIASNNPKLGFESPYDPRSGTGGSWVGVPKMPKEFYTLFCELGGKGEFEVEYEADYSRVEDDEPMPFASVGSKLKVNPDNTINIRQFKTK